MSTFMTLKNHFLIAMPALLDPNFFRSVTYICEHDAEGALGIIINQPINVYLENVFKQIGIDNIHPMIKQQIVFAGGPVHRERGFVLHDSQNTYKNTLKISETISLTTSPDILEAIAENRGPGLFLFALGYAQWTPGQLETELATNAWLSGPASSEVIFTLPVEQRWRAAAALMGVDVDRLSDNMGHA